MGWETVILKAPASQKFNKLHNHSWLCPKCEGNEFTIPFHVNASKGGALKAISDAEREFRVLVCDRCGQFIAFDGCKGECASTPLSKCEVCGKYYCIHCGINEDIEVNEKQVELRYCNDHIPEWYKNR